MRYVHPKTQFNVGIVSWICTLVKIDPELHMTKSENQRKSRLLESGFRNPQKPFCISSENYIVSAFQGWFRVAERFTAQTPIEIASGAGEVPWSSRAGIRRGGDSSVIGHTYLITNYFCKVRALYCHKKWVNWGACAKTFGMFQREMIKCGQFSWWCAGQTRASCDATSTAARI